MHNSATTSPLLSCSSVITTNIPCSLHVLSPIKMLESNSDSKSALVVTNYDVLFVSDQNGRLVKFTSDDHVGNNRFEVFLELHREDYRQAQTQEDRDVIANKIIDIVCHKCIPNGRFLEQRAGLPGDYQDLGQDEVAQDRVCQALEMLETTTLPLRHHPQTSSALVRRTTAGVMTSKDDDSKRRRRGSLCRLRRSISESMVPSMANGIRPMPGKQQQQQPQDNNNNMDSAHPMWKSERTLFTKPPMTPATPVPTSTNNNNDISPQAMDVILNADGISLNPQESYVGNNRFRVLLNMQNTTKNHDATASELVETVTKHWKGRFLKASSAFSPHVLVELNDTEAQSCVVKLLLRQNSAKSKVAPSHPPAAGFMSAAAPSHDEIQSMRWAAVKALKERKQKKQVVDRIIVKRETSNGSLQQQSQQQSSLPFRFLPTKP